MAWAVRRLSPVSITVRDAGSFQRLNTGHGVRARLVAHGDQPGRRIASQQHRDRLARIVQGCDARALLRRERHPLAGRLGRAEEHRFAADADL